jgi:EAL domain-containing protein (putative c-di-GMP-specific phosphodiesterase class I)/GGDEF domain-containing protein
MLYPEEKERENRFKLALRMGLPVFALAVVTTTSVLMRYFNQIPYTFVIIAFGILGVMIYYLFYLIYQGFNERITDPITHTFTREYFTSLMQKDLKKKHYTFMLFSVVNLGDINKSYGFANGDRILYDTAMRIAEYFNERKFTRVPIAHFKGGDFIIALEGTQELYRSFMDIMCVKFRHYSIDDIEIELEGSMTDSTRTQSLEKIVEWLFELQSENRKMLRENDDDIDPDTVEKLVMDAMEARSFSVRYQAAYEGEKVLIYELAVKLVTGEGKLVHQKRFMPAVTRLGVLRQFDEIQTEVALAAVSSLDSGQKIAVDVAPSSLRNPLFFEHIMMYMSNNEHMKERIIFVISENNYYHQSKQFNARLQAFRRAGIRIALDRLGGLHSSMRYLYDLDVDFVRFDAYLGKTITDPKTRALLEGLQQTIKVLGCRSWIRMIEEEKQYIFVKKMGIDIVQGKFLSPIDTIKE